MKKLLIISTLIFFSFFIVDKVGATSVTAYYDSDYVQTLLENVDLDTLNNDIIPFIDENFVNYYVTLNISNNTNSSDRLATLTIMPRNYDNDGAVFMHVRNGYTSMLSYFPYQSINTLYEVSGRQRGYIQFSFDTTTFKTLGTNTNIKTSLSNWLGSPSYASPNNFNDFYITMPVCNTSSCDIEFLNGNYSSTYMYGSLPYYINYPSIIATTLAYKDYQGEYIVHYDDTEYTFELGDTFPTYYRFINNLTPPNKIVTFDTNTFGFYNNIVSLQNLSSNNDLFTIVCDKDKPFENDYCSMNYSDLLSNNSDINFYSDSLFNFHMLFTSNNSGILRDNTYYAYSFRLQQPFHPEVSGIVLNTTQGDLYFGNTIDKVYLVDGGSYTDYIIVFHTDNNGFVSNDKINYISIYFREPLNYYYKVIPNSFNFSVFRSSKLKLYTSMPSADDINDFVAKNDLSSINSNVSQNSFFTDTQFKTYGFGGVVTAPLRLLYSILSYDTCTTINIPFPHSSNTLSLTCVRSSIPSGLSPLISILQVFLSGIICYRIAVGTLSTIKQIFDPTNNSIEVMDL